MHTAVDRWREPAGREDHSTAVVEGDVYLWGGGQGRALQVHNSAQKRTFLSNVEVFSVSTGCWEQRTTIGTPPLGVQGYSCIAVGNELYYFGGGECGHNGCYHNSIHSLSTSTLQWKMLAPTTSEAEGPMRKWCCGMLHFTDGEEDLLYVVGGYGHAAPSSPQHGAQYIKYYPGVNTNEQHIFSLSSNEWSSPEVTGRTPLPCNRFTLAKVGENKAVMFGGWGGSTVDDLFILDLQKRHAVNWTKISKSFLRFQWPEGRYAHAVTNITSSVIVIMGGIGPNDCWLCDSNTKLCKLPLNESVARRQYHSMSALQIGPQCVWLLVFGGYPNIARTTIIELIQRRGGHDQWSVGRIMERDTLSNSKEYQKRLREGRMRGLPAVASMIQNKSMIHQPRQEASKRPAKQQPLMKTVQQTPQHQNCQLQLTHAGQVMQAMKEDEIQKLRRQLQESEQAVREKEQQNQQLQQQLDQSMSMSQEAIQAVNKRVEETQQRIGEKEMELQETILALVHSHQKIEKKEIENQQLLQQLDHSLRAIQAANTRTEEAHQRIREKDEENQDLQHQVQQLQEQVTGEHWVVRREEVEMTKEELGRGGWGVVKVAKFRGLRVAAKCLHQVLISRYNRRQFSREMTIAAKLRHPNLLLFIGATIEGEPVIITELMPTSLRKELEKKELTNEQIITISRDVSCGLNYMHQSRPHPIIHRDISSGNVLLESLFNGWRAKISDYGSANFTNQIASTVGPGTPAYSAPEAPYPDHHTTKMDVFSLGVLMVEMCLGELPESTASHRDIQIQRIPHWPDMVTLIRRCISEQPTDRPNASDIMSALNDM